MDQMSFVKLTVENETQKEVIRILREQNLELKDYVDSLDKKLQESIDLFRELVELVGGEERLNLPDINKTT